MCRGPTGSGRLAEESAVTWKVLFHLGEAVQICYWEVIICMDPSGLLYWRWGWRWLLRTCVGEELRMSFAICPGMACSSCMAVVRSPPPPCLFTWCSTLSVHTRGSRVEWGSLVAPEEKLLVVFAETPRLESWNDKRNAVALELFPHPPVFLLFP